MDDYLARFAWMVEELKTCPDRVVLLNYNVFKPVSDEVVRRVEDALSFALDPSIIAFFKQSNGLQLRWTLRDNPRYDPEKQKFQYEPLISLYAWEKPVRATGFVNILPLERIFLGDWEDMVWFRNAREFQIRFLGVEYDGAFFQQHIKPFDVFDAYYTTVFFIGDREHNPKVLLAKDRHADLTSSKITDFESYMEFLIASRGIVEERKRFYSDAWDSSAGPKDLLITHKDYWTKDKTVDVCRGE